MQAHVKGLVLFMGGRHGGKFCSDAIGGNKGKAWKLLIIFPEHNSLFPLIVCAFVFLCSHGIELRICLHHAF